MARIRQNSAAGSAVACLVVFVTSYAGNRGSGVQKYGYNGPFAMDSREPIGLSRITDGTSHTALMSEWLRGSDNPKARDLRGTVFQTPSQMTEPYQFDDFVRECLTIDGTLAKIGAPWSKVQCWLSGAFGFTLYNHTLGPGQPTCTNGTAFQQGAWTATSDHVRGVNLLFADGHVRFVSSAVDIRVWRALGSRNGGEAIAHDTD